MPMPTDRDEPNTLVWRIPVADLPDVPSDLPIQWADAVRLVSHDLLAPRRHLQSTFADLIWDIELTSAHTVSIGWHSRSGIISSFLVSKGFALDCSTPQCAVWVAETAQDQLAGYEYLLWPSGDAGVYTPQLTDNSAVWTTFEGDVISCIGELPELD